MSDHKFALTLGALGVVFGDIGTSPLYALRETLRHLDVTLPVVLGVLSLIFWSLVLVICVKYFLIVFRADNDGEGGSLALLALMKSKKVKLEPLFFVLSIIGTGLLLGDGMLTSAVSVTSAVEGLEYFSPSSHPFVIPVSASILLFLFWMQSQGTSKIGVMFGPIILVWFVTIGALGLAAVLQHPEVLRACNPYYAYHFLWLHGARGYMVMGGVFLVVTGGEALYADIGHFGQNPIRYAWFFVVLPCLLLNYFGQGAQLLSHPGRVSQPFYGLAPDWFYIPLLLLATCATMIASQSVITATFSLTRQAILLGFFPRVPITQTSKERAGEIYISKINFLLAIGTLFLVVVFQNSSTMAQAYGLAVNLEMLVVTMMVTYTARVIWKGSLLWVVPVFTGLISMDVAFLGANSHKFFTNGWVPVCFALSIAFVMYTWNHGLLYLKQNFHMDIEEIAKILKHLTEQHFKLLPGLTAIFITDTYDKSGGSFLHFLKLCHAVPENILIVDYAINTVPYVPDSKRFEITVLAERVIRMTLHYGFMDDICIPKALSLLEHYQILPFKAHFDSSTYLVEVPHVLVCDKVRSFPFAFQKALFAFLMRNYSINLNIEFYRLPLNQTISIGTYCML